MSTEPLYIDLLITDGDFTLDSGNEPRRCDNRDRHHPGHYSQHSGKRYHHPPDR
ncbi:Uncharacterised protein [Escherichia coli]|uniref:Uncharacterized protein n=1 Tax=Escherichia coli TaxID=562 RepID=A0A376U6H6_ECOLX|nr:Uncharacterised protein [Escherichia coli]